MLISILQIVGIFRGIAPKEIQAVLSFELDICENTSNYCNALENARKLVVVLLRGTDESPFPFKSFRHLKDGSFFQIQNKTKMPWGWPPNGTDIRKSGIFPEIKDKWKYLVAVFSPALNAMIVVTKGEGDYDFAVRVRQLNSEGVWDAWRDHGAIGFEGLFTLNHTLYGITPFEYKIVEFTPELGLIAKVLSSHKYYSGIIKTRHF